MSQDNFPSYMDGTTFGNQPGLTDPLAGVLCAAKNVARQLQDAHSAELVLEERLNKFQNSSVEDEVEAQARMICDEPRSLGEVQGMVWTNHATILQWRSVFLHTMHRHCQGSLNSELSDWTLTLPPHGVQPTLYAASTTIAAVYTAYTAHLLSPKSPFML